MGKNIKNLAVMFIISTVTVLSGCGKAANDMSQLEGARGKFVNQCAKYGHQEAQHDKGPDAPSLEQFQQACGCYYDKGIEAYPDKKALPRAVLSLNKGEDEYNLSSYMSAAMETCDKTILNK
ncbi:hypothetical protein [Wielerella bovis]|uniref:hypothetical protein n=2 Tax=Wielerella bovis TaxID=2917790 RepID=UPI00201967B5|nr:hypothetical protein [Wielerella bovis]ULJ64345.1 hypothetical protein MIS33_09370 [Wielerella bovis]ULJ66564.1 hypothetical protein MIS31_09975 [Wielerella bovis]